MTKKTYLAVTIDTEVDRSPNWATSNPLTFSGVLEAIPNILQPVFKKLGIKPTYFVSNEVMENRECCRVLNSLADCELGAHLHGDFVSPWKKITDLAGYLCKDMEWEYAPDVEFKKLQSLTNQFIKSFGYRPTSFRAGRFGIGHNTGKFLMKLGYLVDSSVTPGIVWTSSKGEKCPDFSTLKASPYFISENGDIWAKGKSKLLEIPVTIKAKAKKQVWFRPWYSTLEELSWVVDHSDETIVMMFHNVELLPGMSPYPQSKKDVQAYLFDLKQALSHAIEVGAIPSTLSEIYQNYRWKLKE